MVNFQYVFDMISARLDEIERKLDLLLPKQKKEKDKK